MADSARERAVDKIARLASQPRDLVTFWQSSTEVIGGVVPYYWTPCWYTFDPASLLVTSHFHDGMPQYPAAELIARLRAKSGEIWGMLGLYREPGQPLFDDADKRFLRSVAPHLAEGARRALLLGEATDPEGPDAPGLLILTDRWEIDSTTPGVERWLADLPDSDWDTGRLPSAVLSVAGRALRTSANPGQPGEVAVSRVLSRSGTWVILHGACLASAGSRRVAIIVEPAHPARTAA